MSLLGHHGGWAKHEAGTAHGASGDARVMCGAEIVSKVPTVEEG
jgi:hypothetical protein